MSDKKTYIELNGIRYDAHTGKVLETPATTSTVHAAEKAKSPVHLKPVLPVNSTVDGFTNRSAGTAFDNTHAKSLPAPKAARTTPFNAKQTHSSPQKSKTLMRPAVNKPNIAKHRPAEKSKSENHKPLIPKDHAARIERAREAKKSSIISRFHTGAGTYGFKKRSENVPVAATPHTHASSSQVHSVSTAAQSATQIGKRFEQAIEQASSHLNKHHTKKKGPNKLAIISSTLSVALLAGFFAYQNVPSVQMQVAASKAGFSADLPGYSPAGFGVAGPIKSEPGKVSLTFKSRTDDKSFQVRQQVSDWSSTALLSNYAQHKSATRTFPDERGRTLYIYGDSNVTWVDGGVWYDIEGNASLSDDQLLRIANSL